MVILGLLFVGWRIIVDTAADGLAATDPETSVSWVASQPDALDELAFREVEKSGGDLNISRGLAERALRSSPLDARALSVLGLIAERQGNQPRADALMRLSGARTWRDATTQAWLVNRNIQLGEFDQALSHVDALLRVDRDVFEQTYPVLSAFTIDRRTFDVLANFLSDAPPWRAGFLARLSGQISDTGRLVQLYAILKDSRHPPDSREVRSYLDRLIGDRRFAEAYQVWHDTLSAQLKTNEVTFPYNGTFEAPIDGLAFNWLLRPAAGVDIQIVAAPGEANGHALRLQFSGARVAQFTVGQLMILPPGEYRLIGKVKAEGLHAQRGLRWHVFCGLPPDETLAVTSLITSSMPWTSFSVDFAVRLENCGAQWLKLEIPDRTPSERQIEGQIWYENILIEPVTKGQQSRPQ